MARWLKPHYGRTSEVTMLEREASGMGNRGEANKDNVILYLPQCGISLLICNTGH